MNQTWENRKKTNSGPNFGLNLGPKDFLWVLPLLGVRHCCKLSLYAISRKSNDPNSRKWQKNSIWVWFRPVGPKIKPQFFSFFFSFAKIWLFQSLDMMVNYHRVQYQNKSNDSILRKLSDRWMHRPTNRLTDLRD